MDTEEFSRTFDFESGFLNDFLVLVDSRIAALESRIDSRDPDTFVASDDMEYVCGLGFVACQRYLTSVCEWLEIPETQKPDSLSVGPTLPNGTHLAVINAAANYWKHTDGSESSLDPIRLSTRKVIEQAGVTISQGHVALSVFEKIGVKDFASLRLKLHEWRDALVSSCQVGRSG